jgi:hypothetical protein
VRRGAVLLLMLGARIAVADPLAPVARAADELAVDLTVEMFLAPNQLGEPTSFAYDGWLGVTDRFTLGVIHSSRSLDRIDAGSGGCLRRGLEDCDRRYANAGLEARYLVRDDVAARVRLLARDVDPWKPAITVGVLARVTRGPLAVTLDPYLRLGLANRDRGNRAALVLPIWLAVSPGPITFALHTGLDGELATWRDGWHVPVGLVLAVRPTPRATVAVEAGFSSLLGPQNDQKHRALMATLSLTTIERQTSARRSRRSVGTARASPGSAAPDNPASRD